jgi:drug/metabolite transporter (DMT)-like permease
MPNAPAPAVARSALRLSPLIVGCLAATWIIWGSTYLAIKWALVSFPPYWQMGTRFLIAGAGLLIFIRWRGAAWPSGVQWRNAVVIGALMLGGGMGGTALAENSVSSGMVVAFIAITPALIALFNRFFGIRPARLEAIGIGIGIAGVLMLTQGAAFSASRSGLLAIISASLCWSLGSVLSQQRFPLASGAVGFASEMLCGGAILMLMSWLRHEHPTLPPDPSALWSWVYLIVFGSLLAFNAYMVLLARASAALASSYSFVNPVIAMLLGIALNNEVVTGFEWFAAAIILMGVILIMMGKR